MVKRDVALGVFGLACVALVMSTASSHAGNLGTEFATPWATITGWAEGTLGKIITTSMVLVGIGAGIARQSLMPFAVGVGGGLGIYSAPTIIGNIFTASVAASAAPDWIATQPVIDLVHVASLIS
jgi:conjugal transfer pilus assembly protein TraA